MSTRNRTRTVWALAAVLVALLLACTARHADAATILTGLGSTNDAVPSDHGSNEPGTLNVALAWAVSSNWDQYADWDGRGDAYQMEGASGVNPATIVFTPGVGYNVAIVSFDLDKWVGGNSMIVEWSIAGDASGVLSAGTWIEFNSVNDPGNDGGRSTLTPNVTGVDGEILTLSLGRTAGRHTSLAMDNLSFDQVQIPEPASLALLGMGSLMMARRRRKR